MHSSFNEAQDIDTLEANAVIHNAQNKNLKINNLATSDSDENNAGEPINQQQQITIDMFQCDICFEKLNCLSGLKQHVTKMHSIKSIKNL